jgi:ketosteroid isomerase-like protein
MLSRFFACAIKKDGDGFAEMFALDGALEFPFAKLRFASRAAIADRARAAWESSPLQPQHFAVRELIESETGLTAEYTVEGLTRDGRPFAVGAIAVLEVAWHEEASRFEIVDMREYLDPVALRAAASTPREVLHRYHAAMRAKDADALAELYADNAVHEFPFFMPDRPDRLIGREAVRASYRESWANHPLEIDAIMDAFVEDGADPEVVIGQWRLEGSLRETGKTVGLTGLLALRVSAGKITHVRDFMDTLGVAHALGRMPFAKAS